MLSAKSDINAADVDWWFIYKLPKSCGPQHQLTEGNEYLYYQSGQQHPLSLSDYRLGKATNGALYHTLQQLLTSNSHTVGWIHYNDEYPESIQDGDFPPNVAPKYQDHSPTKPVNHDHNGHCKGTLAFDLETNSAIWLSHSTPRTPGLHLADEQAFDYPQYADQYAQTFVCISLADVKTAQQIAAVLTEQHQPQVFGCKLPDTVTQDSQYAELWQLAQGSLPPEYDSHYLAKHGRKPPTDITFLAKSGKQFRLLAKSGAWLDDFWIDLVEPKLATDLRIETWRRLTKTASLPQATPLTSQTDYGQHDFTTTAHNQQYHHEFIDQDGQHIDDEITNINLQALTDLQGNFLSNYQWSYTKDHAKWAISEKSQERGQKEDDQLLASANSWICIADMNRMTSQEKRGGGAICFHDALLWQGLNKIQRISGKIT